MKPNLSAPPEIAFCCRCAATMTTREFGGKPRRVCSDHTCGYIHFIEPKVGVGVLVVEQQQLLLVKRAMQPERGKWSLPAGYLDAGENPCQVAVRETKEETNLNVRIDSLIDVFHNPPGQGGATVFILYQATRIGGELQASDDALAAQFFALKQLPELAFASTFAAVERVAQRLTTAET